mmetsp:Transcript_42170/g.126301  ORF Transcript_42170/g.126301 Transcript_42170/m.126301 type:complete len:283 (-) Transcript_42170:652-1500(-)
MRGNGGGAPTRGRAACVAGRTAGDDRPGVVARLGAVCARGAAAALVWAHTSTAYTPGCSGTKTTRPHTAVAMTKGGFGGRNGPSSIWKAVAAVGRDGPQAIFEVVAAVATARQSAERQLRRWLTSHHNGGCGGGAAAIQRHTRERRAAWHGAPPASWSFKTRHALHTATSCTQTCALPRAVSTLSFWCECRLPHLRCPPTRPLCTARQLVIFLKHPENPTLFYSHSWIHTPRRSRAEGRGHGQAAGGRKAGGNCRRAPPYLPSRGLRREHARLACSLLAHMD